MAARLAERNKKQAIAQERELFSEIAMLKTFRVQRTPVWYMCKFILLHECRINNYKHSTTQTMCTCKWEVQAMATSLF